MRMDKIRCWLWLGQVLGCGLLSGCGSLSYYSQAIQGQWDIWQRSEPIADVLAGVNPETRQALLLSQALSAYAIAELGLPDTDSYQQYADLQRNYVVWNVVAAPELDMTPKEWCFLIVGCLSYRGYFDQADAQAYAQRLRDEGWEVYDYPVTAYSTLGYFADPLLNTMPLDYPLWLAELLFHEIAHQQMYVPDETEFNEAFATVVADIGVKQWLTDLADGHVLFDQLPVATYLSQADVYYRERTAVREITQRIMRSRDLLIRTFKSKLSEAEKRQRKQQLIADLQQWYAAYQAQHPQVTAFRSWFAAPLNTPKLNSVATYYDWVPLLQQLYDACPSLPAFYQLAEQGGSQLPAGAEDEMDSLLLKQQWFTEWLANVPVLIRQQDLPCSLSDQT